MTPTATNAVANLVIDRTAPILGSALVPALEQPGTNLLSLSTTMNEASPRAGEYWTGTTDPGAGNATPITINTTIPDANGNSTVSIDVPFPAAATTYHLRVQDMAGNWSTAAVVTVRPYRNTFETAPTTTNRFGWSSETNAGQITRQAAARQANADELFSRYGMQVNATSVDVRTAFGTDADSGSGHAVPRAVPAGGADDSGSGHDNVVTLFDTTTATNGEVFALQYQGTGASAADPGGHR